MAPTRETGVVEAFVAALPDPDLGVDAGAELGPALTAALATAAAAHPDIAIDPARFAAYLGQRIPADDEPVPMLARLCLGDLWLAAGCVGGDPRAIAAFEDRFGSQMAAALAPMNLGRDVVDDVCQEVRRKLLVAEPDDQPRIADYSGRADLRTWIRTTVVRTAIDQLRRQRDLPVDAEELEALPLLADDPELVHLKSRYRDELRDAFAEGFAQLPPRDRALLKYTYLDGLGVDRVGAIYRVHRATAARWVAAARETLGRTVQKLLARRLGIEPTELVRIIRLVESQLDLSIRRHLA